MRFLKFTLQIQYIEWKTQTLGDTACIVNIVERTAPARQWVTVFIHTDPSALVPQLHRKADQLVPLLLEKRGCRRTIDATAHCYC